MSPKPIVPNADIQRLQEEGLEVEILNGHLLVHSVPYVDNQCNVRRGILVSSLSGPLVGLGRPHTHQVWFQGDFPCAKNGRPIAAIRNNGGQRLWEGFEVQYQFSNKPEQYFTAGFPDYYTQMRHYISIISSEAAAIDKEATAYTGRVVVPVEEDSPFRYSDFSSSRAGILAVAAKLRIPRLAIIGLGGTGSYVLDQAAKTPIEEIHLFDGDIFGQHNSFRAPGAATIEQLDKKPMKVDHFAQVYGAIHKRIMPHPYRVTDENVAELSGFNFVFLCVDKPGARKLISDFLIAQGIPFIDVGMEILHLTESDELCGTCRMTMVTPEKSGHFSSRAPLAGDEGDDLYTRNIQVADMNMLNAALAVYKWKQYYGFYQDIRKVHHATFSINDHSLARAETVESEPEGQ